jgi:ABC-type phosphate/phosphonate transport system permease subunit
MKAGRRQFSGGALLRHFEWLGTRRLAVVPWAVPLAGRCHDQKKTAAGGTPLRLLSMTLGTPRRHLLYSKFTRWSPDRRFGVASRSINSLIWALLLVLVLILGPGVLAGIIAIALRSIGFIGKHLYEAIEEIDERQVEAIRTTGAASTQVLSYGVWPQVLPAFAGISVYRWDINIREATILGLVGAGDIGVQLQASVTCSPRGR